MKNKTFSIQISSQVVLKYLPPLSSLGSENVKPPEPAINLATAVEALERKSHRGNKIWSWPKNHCRRLHNQITHANSTCDRCAGGFAQTQIRFGQKDAVSRCLTEGKHQLQLTVSEYSRMRPKAST